MTTWLLILVLIGAKVPSVALADPTASGFLGIQMENPTALVIGIVLPETSAERAGLRPGDVLVQVGTLRPQTFEQVVSHVKSFRPGSVLMIQVNREGETVRVPVRLMARPATAQ